MGEVFAGFVCGYILAILGAPLMALTMVRMRTGSPLIQRLMPPGTSMVAFTVVLHGALIFACTGAGLFLGLLLLAMKDAGAGLGSPNFAFTLFVLGATAVVFAPLAALLARFRRPLLATALVVMLLFGWLMPYMAQWSKFSSS